MNVQPISAHIRVKTAASGLTVTRRLFVSSVIDGAALKTDERLRVAKERREEQEKQQGEAPPPLLTKRSNPRVYKPLAPPWLSPP